MHLLLVSHLLGRYMILVIFPTPVEPLLVPLPEVVVYFLINTAGVLGLLGWLGTFPAALLVPVFTMNVPIEIALALVVSIPVMSALRAVGRGRIAAAQD